MTKCSLPASINLLYKLNGISGSGSSFRKSFSASDIMLISVHSWSAKFTETPVLVDAWTSAIEENYIIIVTGFTKRGLIRTIINI